MVKPDLTLGRRHGAAADKPQMYQLIRETGSIRDRTAAIEFLEPGIRADGFTLG